MDQVEAEDPTFHQAALEDEAETAEKIHLISWMLSLDHFQY